MKNVSVLRHGDDYATFATRTQIEEFKEDLSKPSCKPLPHWDRDHNSLTCVKYDF